MLKPFFLSMAVVAITVASATAPALPPQDAAPSPGVKSAAKLTPEAHAKAKKIYEIDCAICHGPTGDGKTDIAKDMQLNLLDWTDPNSLANKSDHDLFESVRKGKGKMPAEDEGRAKNDDLKNLIIYIRKFAKDQPAAPAASHPAAAPEPSSAPSAAPAAAPAPGK
jgi:cytochrome c5